MGAFSSNMSIATSLYAELSSVIFVVNHAHAGGWAKLFLASDPSLAKIKWNNCLNINNINRRFRFGISHIYRHEENSCVELPINTSYYVINHNWWDTLPPYAMHGLIRDKSHHIFFPFMLIALF